MSKKFKILIAGSDQIWNSSEQYGLDENYFLNFSNKTFNISYAASFGKDSLEVKYFNKIKKLPLFLLILRKKIKPVIMS